MIGHIMFERAMVIEDPYLKQLGQGSWENMQP